MFRYKLRTLLILLAIGPPLIALAYWAAQEYQRRREINRIPTFDELVELITTTAEPMAGNTPASTCQD
jgi:hypothetical protein